jgi:hypothetical protein
MSSTGVAGHVVIGTCFGARTGLIAASRIEDLRAIALVSLPVRDVTAPERRAETLSVTGMAKKLVDPRVLRRVANRHSRSRYRTIVRTVIRNLGGREKPPGQRHGSASPAVVDALSRLADRGVPVLMLYSDADEYYVDFDRARADDLGRLVENAESIAVEVVPDPSPTRSDQHRLDVFATLDAQDDFLNAVPAWLNRTLGRATGGP